MVRDLLFSQHVTHSFIHSFIVYLVKQVKLKKAYSGTLTRREIVRANASLGELRRDKEKLSSPISCELRRVKAS